MRRIFRKCFAADENYPIYILSLNDEFKNIKNIQTTFVNWKELSRDSNGKRSPKYI